MIRTCISHLDNRRREITWLVLALLAALGVTLALVLYLGYASPPVGWDGWVNTVGLVGLLSCAIVYFAGKEREQRLLNQSLVASLQQAVRDLHERASRIDELASTNLRLNGALEGLREELDQHYLRALRALMSTLDARDNYAALHGEQVTAVAAAIARRMGLEPSLVSLINAFGPLHDIGKIGIADTILCKPEPLETDELALCMQHPAVGAAIIAPLRPPPEALALIRSHHERWDGSGYPDRLAGSNIPLLARIMAVADAYHAIISQRPYHAAREQAHVVTEMSRHAGAQFDPDVVGVLAQLVAEGAIEARGAR